MAWNQSFRITYNNTPISTQDIPMNDEITVIEFDDSITAIHQIVHALKHAKKCLIINKKWPTAFKAAIIDQLPPLLNDGHIILATSGSTGQAKLCLHHSQSIYQAAKRGIKSTNITNESRIILALKPYHMGGLLTIAKAMAAGAELVAGNTHWMQQVSGTNIQLAIVPTHLDSIIHFIQANKQRMNQFESILIGGDRVNPTKLQLAHDLGIPITTSYGSTETAGQILSSTRIDGCATPLEACRVTVSSSNELLVKTPTLAKAYIQQKTITPIPLNSDGWYPTNDRASIAANGLITILGRINHAFNSGGEFVQPEMIEHILLAHPKIDRAIVLPYPDKQFGHVPMAIINQGCIEADIIAYCSDQLPIYMVPKIFKRWPKNIDPNAPTVRQLLIQTIAYGYSSDSVIVN